MRTNYYRIIVLLLSLLLMQGAVSAKVRSGSIKKKKIPIKTEKKTDTAEKTEAPVSDQPAEKPEKDMPESVQPETDTPDEEAFSRGYKLFEKESWERAAPYFYRYLSTHTRDDQDYEWAEFFFGICLRKLGLSHASMDTLSYLVTRKPNTKIVTYSLEIFEEISRTMPFDRDLIINKAICDQDYGFVDSDIRNFIHYYQGLYDWEHGFNGWGNDHFKQIEDGTYYFYKFRYQKVLQAVYQDNIDEAIRILNEILESPVRDENLKDDARKTLARLLYEKEAYREADKLYDDIQRNILEQSQNLLERAWAHYRIGNPEKAMGFLYAFEAPSFKNHFTPEYYILKSFIYKDVCHYQSAMEVVEGFRSRYGQALEQIYHRGNPEENYPLMLVLLGKPKILETWKFLELLESEKDACRKYKKDIPIYRHLMKIYDLQISESTNMLKQHIQDEYEKTANQLLQYEEEAHLMAYEIGLDMYQRIYEYHYSGEGSEDNRSEKGIVVYPFQGEFWNDELADYKVILPNKCENVEEWDIFFK